MHISMRYGNKDGVPVFHLNESINQGRVSPRGLANQSWLKKTINNQQLINPDEKVSIGLRASNDQIIAVGILNPTSYDTLPHMWSGDQSYRTTWDVEWKEVFSQPLTPAELCSKYGINDDMLMKQFHHAQHSWNSPDLTIDAAKGSVVLDWLESTFEFIAENLRVIDVMENFLSQTLEWKDHMAIVSHAHAMLEILDTYPRASLNTSAWQKNLKTSKSSTKRRKQTSSTRKKITKAQKKDRSFAKKMRKIISEAETLGIKSDYAMASYFTKKGYARKDGKRSWNGKTVGVYRTKYVLA
mgnify:CR=1 FL=1